ncbi:Retrovirus-related Pol polyprotein from transposon TNT 1-94 Includes: RecName: Full=Protease [Rhizoctonia solani AG-1 IB]|uniref:Rhizoctonia solani AG1-IB WGS project CAOJ00000000 data, isolate 7/3/14, contig 21879 n=1 Tax=Thanatephorus cucumeris (strain AG1-IB / isolate 7/3/14) TaxID=1108050 RepID=M5C9R5_THACB|nr:Retrovirus-related Pol polyprotein from transposon TNT 1-94 Includes: RecName: Full=Protease [Rhizoctonia solani AG-1 IB]
MLPNNAYDNTNWDESVVLPAEGEEMTRTSSTAEQRDKNARTGGANRVSKEVKKETKPTTTESKATTHTAVPKPTSTCSKLTMPYSGTRLDTLESARKLNANPATKSSGVQTRCQNPNKPKLYLDTNYGGVKITVKDTNTAPNDNHTSTTDLSLFCSHVPSLVSNVSSIVSPPTVPSKLTFELATPEVPWLPTFTTAGELEGQFGELKLMSECFPPPTKLTLAAFTDDNPHWVFASIVPATNDNLSVEEALSGPDKDKWKAAMDTEIATLEKQGTFVPAILPPGRNAMGCRWVLTIKQNKKNKPVWYKARLVVQGFSQQPGIDYGQTFAPVLNVTSAFLHSDVEEELYMRPIPYYNNGSSNVLRLCRSLYRLKQARCMWNYACVYHCIMDISGKLHVSIIAVHVDDSIVVTTPNNTTFVVSKLL